MFYNVEFRRKKETKRVKHKQAHVPWKLSASAGTPPQLQRVFSPRYPGKRQDFVCSVHWITPWSTNSPSWSNPLFLRLLAYKPEQCSSSFHWSLGSWIWPAPAQLQRSCPSTVKHSFCVGRLLSLDWDRCANSKLVRGSVSGRLDRLLALDADSALAVGPLEDMLLLQSSL